MAQLSRQATLYRFRCPKCNLRLKVDAQDRGKNIVCPQCQNLIVAERSSHHAPEESVIQRLDETVDQWVRTTCTCGKLIKAPAAFAGRTGHCPQCSRPITMPALGETMSSALEVSTFVQAPSEESLLMAVAGQDDPSSTSDIDNPEITYSRLTPPEQYSKDSQYVRAACICGTEVHAALEMAGKTVRCPKCNNLLHLPYKPLSRPVFDFDDMGRKDLHFGGESLVFKPHMASAGKSIISEIDPSKEIKAIPTQAEWDHEKQARAIHIRSIRGESQIQIKARQLALGVSHATSQVRQVLWGNNLAAMITSSVVLAGSLALFSAQYINHWEETGNQLPTMQESSQIRFYDLGAGQFFRVSSDTTPPVIAPSQAGQNPDTPLGVRVYVFTCQSCDSDQDVFPVLIENMTSDTGSGFARRMEITGIPQIPSLLDPGVPPTPGRLISKPKPVAWVDVSTPEGTALLQSAALTRCPSGELAQQCR